ncbi:MAG: InlB B-repeat-containing protein, partial [Candidatus Izemoplasmataceae bacterium]
MKKLFLVLTLLIAIFTLSACNNPEEPDIEPMVTLESNLEDVTPTLTTTHSDEAIEIGDEVTVTAPDVTGYRFVYWLNKELNIIMSNDQAYTFSVKNEITLKAIYHEIETESPVNLTLTSNQEAAVLTKDEETLLSGDEVTVTANALENYTFDGWYEEETLVSSDLVYTFTINNDLTLEARYSSALTESTITLDFEEDLKASYAIDTVTFDELDYILDDTLIGSLENDQKNGEWALRMRNGFFEPDFSFTYIETISFYAGRFLSDDASTFEVLVSSDGENYTAIDSYTADEW